MTKTEESLFDKNLASDLRKLVPEKAGPEGRAESIVGNVDLIRVGRKYEKDLKSPTTDDAEKEKLWNQALEAVRKTRTAKNVKKWPDGYEDYRALIVTLKQKVSHLLNSSTEPIQDLFDVLTQHNVIFHGAPGTGKTRLAHLIAERMILGEMLFEELEEKRNKLSESSGNLKESGAAQEENAKADAAYRSQQNAVNSFESDHHLIGKNAHYGFVQFHPSYDYTDFVEGLRPAVETSNDGASGAVGFELRPGTFYEFCALAKTHENERNEAGNPSTPYIFVIDEINRGDISKIFGELFFSIDPGYRGPKGSVRTQYWNLHDSIDYRKHFDGKNPFPNGFYVPENVYVIGTMNDIDRSVDSFDFAMRRRFAFKEVEPDSRVIDSLEAKGVPHEVVDEAKRRMNNLNEAIKNQEELSADYQIGQSYFLTALKDVKDTSQAGDSFESLWKDQLEPLLESYLQGSSTQEEAESTVKSLEKAYYEPNAQSQPDDAQDLNSTENAGKEPENGEPSSTPSHAENSDGNLEREG